MANLIPTVERVINLAWNALHSELTNMGGEAKPKTAPDVFSYRVTDTGVEVTMARYRKALTKLSDPAHIAAANRALQDLAQAQSVGGGPAIDGIVRPRQ